MIRFDQPGAYAIKPGLTWANSSDVMKVGPHYCVEVFFRPEMNYGFRKGISKLGVMYLNHINLCDQQQYVYASLPYRVYFKYKEVGIRSNGIAFEVVDWKEIRQAAGESGKVIMPATTTPMDGIFMGPNPDLPGDYWKIEIPRDRCYSLEEAGGIVIPGKPIE